MATPKQIAANRRNALKSTGPRTPEGRAAVRFNALKHGLTASHVVIHVEDHQEFEDLANSLLPDLRPVGALEKFVFQQIVVAAWRLRRARGIEAGYCDLEIIDREPRIKDYYTNLSQHHRLAFCLRDELQDSHPMASLSRNQTRIERSFYRSLHELQRLQAQRNAAQAPSPSGAPPPAPDNTKNAKQTQSENSPAPDPRFSRPALQLDNLHRPLLR